MAKKNNITTFEEHLEKRYGKIGTKRRKNFELKSKTFIIAEMIKDARRRAKLTQNELAIKSRTKKSYISRIENGQSDIQLKTLFKIIEDGLGKQLTLRIK
ncbi:MAG: helix-turn-helix domain-containing protein [Chlorobi bacterium]|nr:helix-turn-helix domain-containing protein [Chlorobiota bacterium]MCI0715308.1 helix-turn-helix domain-containing protein [Chlorobiota bacterium]